MFDKITFPILGSTDYIPYELVEEHEEQAMKNHGGQTVEKLAKRGGLNYQELACVLVNQPFNKNLSIVKAKKTIDIMVNRWWMRPKKESVTNVGLRPCIIKSPANNPGVEMKAYFHRWIEGEIEVLEPLSELHNNYSNIRLAKGIVALVEYEDGKLGQWPPENIQFTDR
jgi:hypothetical protein